MIPDSASTGEEAPWVDAATCREWLKTLPLGNPVQTQALLLHRLRQLNHQTLPPDVRLALLETLREAVGFAQSEIAKRFSGKPLPLTAAEQALANANRDLWQTLAAGYGRCLESCLAGDAGFKPRAGLVCQRGLAALVDEHMDLVRAGFRPEGSHWRLVHGFYASAEALGVTTATEKDALRGLSTATPSSMYAELMLLHTAGLHELPPRPQSWVMRWARRWAGKIILRTTPPALDQRALPLCADLESDTPAGFKPHTGPGARWLDTTELRKSLKKRILLLAEENGQHTPAALGLGEDCVEPQCTEMLRRVYPRWTKGGILRRHERHPLGGPCRFVAGIEAIHYYLSGRLPFKAPGKATADELRRQREELATFGRVAERFDEEYSRAHGFQVENWEVMEDWGLHDESAAGLSLSRPIAQGSGRLGIGQLIAVQPANGSTFLLGCVRWTQVTGERLSAGISLLPGKSLPVAVRGTGVMAAQEKYKPGFVLPPAETLGLPLSIVLPSGNFKAERIMETWSEGITRHVRLKTVRERGTDFECIACEEFSPR